MRPRLGAWVCGGALALGALAGCAEKAAAPVDAGVAGPVVPPPPVPKAPLLPFRPSKLSCASLLPAARAEALLGFSPTLFERVDRRDGETSVVCANRGPLLARTFSFQVTCGKKQPPKAVFERLFALHEQLAGAKPLPEKRGVEAPSSYLALHPYRPCFVQVAGRAPAARPGVGRLWAEIAAAVP